MPRGFSAGQLDISRAYSSAHSWYQEEGYGRFLELCMYVIVFLIFVVGATAALAKPRNRRQEAGRKTN